MSHEFTGPAEGNSEQEKKSERRDHSWTDKEDKNKKLLAAAQPPALASSAEPLCPPPPPEPPKKPEACAGLKREWKLFAKTTGLHGIRRLWEATGACSKALWSVLVLVLFGLMCALIVLNILSYLRDDGSTKVTHGAATRGMALPKVTFCNTRPIKKRNTDKFNASGDMTEELLNYIIMSNWDPTMMEKSPDALKNMDDEFAEYQQNHPDFTFRNFFEQTGFTCQDVFKSCAFGGKKIECCHKDHFHSTFTDLGLCQSITFPEVQTTESEKGGLQLIIDAQTDMAFQTTTDAEELFDYPLTDGFRFYLEEPGMRTYRSAHGISVGAGQSISTAVQLKKFKQIYGCRSDWDGLGMGESSAKYQARDCKSKCLAELYNKHCSCAPLVFDIDSKYTTCTPKQAAACSNEAEIQRAMTFERDTACAKCEVECDRIDYQSLNSYGGPLSRNSTAAMKGMIKETEPIKKEEERKEKTASTAKSVPPTKDTSTTKPEQRPTNPENIEKVPGTVDNRQVREARDIEPREPVNPDEGHANEPRENENPDNRDKECKDNNPGCVSEPPRHESTPAHPDKHSTKDPHPHPETEKPEIRTEEPIDKRTTMPVDNSTETPSTTTTTAAPPEPIDPSRIEKDFTLVRIYYRELSSLEYQAVSSSDIVTLLSHIGGVTGLCLGFSILTFIEIIVFCFKCSCSCCFKEDKKEQKAADAAKNLEKQNQRSKHRKAQEKAGPDTALASSQPITPISGAPPPLQGIDRQGTPPHPAAVVGGTQTAPVVRSTPPPSE